MAAAMEAGTTVIHNFSPPSTSSILRRRFPNFPAKYSLFSGVPLTCIPNRTSRFPTLSASQGPGQAEYGGDKNGIILTSSTVLALAKPLLDFAFANLLPFTLVAGVALGIKSPALGCLAHRYSLSKFITSWLFFASGLKMQDGDLDAVIEAWPAAFYGLAFILLLSPLFSKLILQLQLAPQEFVIGLAIFSCMPTALNGGVALTQLVGGNSALALALTVTSVILGMLTVPLWITKFFADGFGVAIPTWKLFQNLLLILIVPLILGKVMRNSFPGLATYVDQNERFFSITTSILLGFFPWMQVSKSRALLMMVKPEVFVGAAGMGILVHVFFLAFNAIMIRILSADSSPWKAVFEKKENSRALILVCSQRSLLIATAIVEQIGGVLGESGLLVLPSVAADVNQIVIDSLLVNFWLRKDKSCNNIKRP
uniref:Probable sodium/metabolite cotransporter BASS4, chloroplastic n=1 Tax=Opuntia streptacantha TaxID=393608 RepID=A0A7C8YMN0_OPUST